MAATIPTVTHISTQMDQHKTNKAIEMQIIHQKRKKEKPVASMNKKMEMTTIQDLYDVLEMFPKKANGE